METFAKLFGSLLALVYHCFDRIVILGHVPLLTRPEHIVLFFRHLKAGAITKDLLRKRTNEYNRWVETYRAKKTTSGPCCAAWNSKTASGSTTF